MVYTPSHGNMLRRRPNCVTLTTIIALLCVCFFLANIFYQKSQPETSTGNVSQKRLPETSAQVFSFDGRAHDDPELIAFIRQELRPPPREPLSYNLVHPEKKDFTENGQLGEMQKIFKNKTDRGFFIEVGGFTGEEYSPTLYWEREKNWTGLLIEPHPYYYSLLEGKNRRATILHAGLSPTDKANTLTFRKEGWGTKIIPKSAKDGPAPSGFFDVPCFPLSAILHAIGNPTIDFFSLDVETFELKVLRSINLSLHDIRVFMIEYLHVPEGKAGLIEYMESHGYKTWGSVPGDTFFIKKGVQF